MASSQPPPTDPAGIARGLRVLIDHTKRDLGLKREPPTLSHYRTVPERLQTAYALVLRGAQLVRATATKYALVGAIDTNDQGNLGADLLKGCELIGAAAHTTMQDPSGCSRAVREHTQKAALSVYIATLRLVEAFHPSLQASRDDAAVATKTNTVGAQKTGAVWEACDHIINKMMPKGNRNAMRREILRWTRDCNDTMEEFQELVDLGPAEAEEEEADEPDDDFGNPFGGDDDDQYTSQELPMAKAGLGLLKNSRGSLRVALEACEALGKLVVQPDPDDEPQQQQQQQFLATILALHRDARKIGEGVTDLGSLLYPPLVVDELASGIGEQAAHLGALHERVLSVDAGVLPDAVTELARTLQTAAAARHGEFREAAKAAAGE